MQKGNTAIVAEMIADETGVDMFEILPQGNIQQTRDPLMQIPYSESQQNKPVRAQLSGRFLVYVVT